jgi:hypothetical protein
MNCSLAHNAALMTTEKCNAETLATFHENAKQRAHALRREAMSGFVDSAFAWLSRKSVASENGSVAKRQSSIEAM